MEAGPLSATPADLVALADRWVVLMESEDYDGAHEAIDQLPHWTPELMRSVVKAYGDADPNQKVTMAAEPTDVTQRREVDRWPADAEGVVGEIWYDLGIDRFVSDLTATFAIIEKPAGLVIRLSDIHVM